MCHITLHLPRKLALQPAIQRCAQHLLLIFPQQPRNCLRRSERKVSLTCIAHGALKQRFKSRIFGVWLNTDVVTIDQAPSFYAVATTGPFSDIVSDTEDLRNSISIPRAIRSVGAPQTVQNAQAFSDALIRLRLARGLYSMNESAVRLTDQTLFRTDIDLPANLVEGNYKTRIFLLRDKRVVSLYEKTIFVRKVGLERWLFRLAHQQPAAYGILALVIAAVAGWAASAIFRLVRR